MNYQKPAPLRDSIRQALRENPEGLTASAISAEVETSHQAVCNAIDQMTDLFVVDWYPHSLCRRWVEVYALKPADECGPQDAPKPEIKVTDYLRKIGQATSIAA